MSRFKTTISVDFDALISAAPRGTHIHSATLSDDKKSVVVVWDNPRFVSHGSEGIEFPVEKLKNGELPNLVVVADWDQNLKTVKVEDSQPEAQPESVGVGNKEVVSAPIKRKK